jgi:hypothetical protein
MYTHTHTYLYTFMHAYIHIHKHIYIYSYTGTYTHINIRIYIHTYTYIHTYKRHAFKPFTSRFLFLNLRFDYKKKNQRSLQGGPWLVLSRCKTKLGRKITMRLLREDGMGGLVRT